MSEYHTNVAEYFDRVACSFEDRYWENPVLHRMRQVFREEAKAVPWRAALEVGCGTGMDLVHFATIFPERRLVGIDLAPQMVTRAQQRILASGKANVSVHIGSVEDALQLVEPESQDLCYVFFGALNTTPDIGQAADHLYALLRPGGHLLLTFVNRWYLAEIAIGLAKGRFDRALARLRREWPGYTPEHPLASRCFGPRSVDRAFGRQGDLVRRRGLCITYPAWYRKHLVGKLGRYAELLWRFDRWVSRTPVWASGEYAIYVYRKRSSDPSP